MTSAQDLHATAVQQLGVLTFTNVLYRVASCRRFGVLNAMLPDQLPACALTEPTWHAYGRKVNDDAVPIELVACHDGWPERVVRLVDAIDTSGKPFTIVRGTFNWVHAAQGLTGVSFTEGEQARLHVDSIGTICLQVGAQLHANDRVARHMLAHMVCPDRNLVRLVDTLAADAASCDDAMDVQAVNTAERMFDNASQEGKIALLECVRRSLIQLDALCWPYLGCGVGSARIKVLSKPSVIVDEHFLRTLTVKNQTLIRDSWCALCACTLGGQPAGGGK